MKSFFRKPRRQLWSLLLVLSLTLANMQSLGLAADAETNIFANNVTTYPGQSFTVTVQAQYLEDLASLDLFLYYDSAAFELLEASEGTLLSEASVSINTNNPGSITFGMATSEALTGGGELMRLRFLAKDTVSAKDYRLWITVGEALNSVFESITVSSKYSVITVAEPVVGTQTFSVYGEQDSTIYETGDTIDVEFYSAYVSNLATAYLVMTYDSALLKFNSLTLSEKILSAENVEYSVNTANAGVARIAFALPQGISDSFYPLLTGSFTAKNSAAASTAVTLEVRNVYDVQNRLIKNSQASVTLSLKEKTVLPEAPIFALQVLNEDKLAFDAGILAPGSTNLRAGDFIVNYDPSLLSFVSCDSKYYSEKEPGQVQVSYISSAITEDTVISTLHFAKENTACTDTSISLSVKGLYDGSWKPITAGTKGISVHTHEFPPNSSWSWEGDYSAAELTLTCAADAEHVIGVFAAEISSVRTEPTCEATGSIIYTATVTFAGETYTDTRTEVLAATGHEWDVENIVWNWIGYTAATATFSCKNNPDHTECANAEIHSVRTEPTCEEAGSVIYTATVIFGGETYTDTRTEVLAATEHEWDTENVVWNWTGNDALGYSAAAAVFRCRKDQTHIMEIQAAIDMQQENGSVTYTATVELNGIRYTDVKVVTENTAIVVSAAAIVNDRIDLRFTVLVPDTAANIVLLYDNEIDSPKVKNLSITDAGEYRLTMENIPAKEMGVNIELKVLGKDGEILRLINSAGREFENHTLLYSVSDYLNSLIALEGDHTYDKYIVLAKTMLNYGEMAQRHFKFRENELVNPNGYMQNEMQNVQVDAAYNGTFPSADDRYKVGFKTMSINLEGETQIFLYFDHQVVAKDDKGNDCQVEQNGSRYRVIVPGIKSNQLHKPYTVVVSEDGQDYSFTCCALTYCNLVLNSTGTSISEAMRNVCRALYLYNAAAVAAFGEK